MLKKYVYHDVNYRGRIERVSYVARNGEGREAAKYANVYLPYGYDDGSERKYDILYLMHGGQGNPDSWLDCCPFKNMLDCSFLEKVCEPFIVVFPSYYSSAADVAGLSHMDREGELVREFPDETVKELIPAVESRVRGWAETFDEEGLRASRSHRAFGGFSMGAVTTWYEFIRNLKVFATFLPLSGDCWAVDHLGGFSKPSETADVLARAAEEAVRGGCDFRIFVATGSEDSACVNLAQQIEEMKHRSVFRFSEDLTEGNFHYEIAQGAEHTYGNVLDYTYSFLPYLFP